MKKKEKIGSRLFDIIIYIIMAVLILITFYPLYYVVCASFSDPGELVKHTGLLIIPRNLSIACYKAVFAYKRLYVGYGNTILYMLAGTGINMLLTVIGGYALSRKNVYGVKTVMKFIVFTMFFGGGLIPTFLLVKGIGLYDTLWAVILPHAISTMNMIIMKTAFSAVPESLPESAKIDGANDFTILFRIMIALCMPTVSVLILFYSVGHWNSFFEAMIYLKDQAKHPLQLILRALLMSRSTDAMGASSGAGDQINMAETLKYSIIVVSTLPILIVYPFLQKYFTSGVMIGAVKG